MCGETDWRCFELHHVSGQRYGPMTVPICINDHLRVTDRQKDHPTMNKEADLQVATLNNFLRGLADMLRIIADKLIEFADGLIARMSDDERSARS